MFQLSFVKNELRRRMSRTILSALGLAAGVALVIGITGITDGLDTAQNKVLSPLSSIGTDILVTRVAGATTPGASTTTTSAPQNGGGAGGRGGGFFGGGGGGGGAGGLGISTDQLNSQDTASLLSENNNVVTDLSKLGKPGDKFTHDFFLSATMLSFPQAAVDQVKAIPGVKSLSYGLTQLAEHQTGTVPNIVATVQTGGEQITSTVTPAPLSDAERQAMRQCLINNGAFQQAPSGNTPTSTGGGGEGGGRGGGGGLFRGDQGDNSAFEKCLPARYQQYNATVVAPARTIQQIVNPPQTDITNNSYVAAGIDTSTPDMGLVTQSQLTAGRWLGKDAQNEVLLNTAYANKNSLAVNSTLPINGQTFTVVGIVNPSLSGDTADIYFNLTKMQELASKQNRVTQILVKAKNANEVDALQKKIEAVLPGATVITTKSLSDQVKGSLADAKKLANGFGTVLAIVGLISAFAIAALLTLSSVTKRVREIGTLRAIGWSKSRVVGQIMSETLFIGLIGAVIGIAIGSLAIVAVNLFSPKLTATASGITGLSGSSYSKLFGQSAQAVTKASTISLHAPFSLVSILIGVGVAVLGGLVAGTLGGWRAAQATPADALRTVG